MRILNIFFNFIPLKRTLYSTRNALNIPLLNTNHNFFKKSFFPSTIIEWNKLDPGLRKAESLSVFKTNILKFIGPSLNSVYNCHNPKGLNFITRFRLVLTHLREHKFKHSFQDAINPICSCGLDIASLSTSFYTVPNLSMTITDNTRIARK